MSVFPRTPHSAHRARGWAVPLADADAMSRAELCVFAVPDAAVGPTAHALSPRLGRSAARVHCAGALELSALGGAAKRGSFHPLCAISDARDPLSGHAVALSATQAPLLRTLRRMAGALKLHPFSVPESGRAAYHAGAVLCAGGVVSLAAAGLEAFRAAGVSEREATRALLPLMRSALRGLELRGAGRGLTGPVVRGDLEVVRAHLRALPGSMRDLYRQLSLRALSLATLPPHTRLSLTRLLRPPRRRHSGQRSE